MASSSTGNERTLGRLVADATSDISSIVRSEIELARRRSPPRPRRPARAPACSPVPRSWALLGLIFLFHTLAQVIDIWLPLWAGYLITTALLFVVAVILGLVGRNSMSQVQPVPERTIKNAQDTIDAIKSAG